MSNNSPENRKARRQYREYYESQPPDVRAQLPLPEREEDITGMDGNWVFPVNESHNWSESGAGKFDQYHYNTNAAHRAHQDAQEGDAGEPTGEPQYEPNASANTHRSYTEDEMQEVIRRIVLAMQLSESADVLFHARCILIALGIGDPPKESELARIKGCSRQFVSKKVKRIQQLFNLTPSQFMRSEAACRAYARAYQRHHKKHQPQASNHTIANPHPTPPRPTPSPHGGLRNLLSTPHPPLGNEHLRPSDGSVENHKNRGKSDEC